MKRRRVNDIHVEKDIHRQNRKKNEKRTAILWRKKKKKYKERKRRKLKRRRSCCVHTGIQSGCGVTPDLTIYIRARRVHDRRQQNGDRARVSRDSERETDRQTDSLSPSLSTTKGSSPPPHRPRDTPAPPWNVSSVGHSRWLGMQELCWLRGRTLLQLGSGGRAGPVRGVSGGRMPGQERWKHWKGVSYHSTLRLGLQVQLHHAEAWRRTRDGTELR